jgi:Zn-dependent protease with chaperone function
MNRDVLRAYLDPILVVAGLQPEAVHLYIVNDPSINAFVAEGQNMFLHTGLLMQLDFPNEVIGVMAHETGHMAGGHLVRTTQGVKAAMIPMLDVGAPTLILAGVHAGCQELFASERVRTVRDLKGKRIAVTGMGNGDHIFIASILAYVGIDPKKEVTWITGSDLMGAMKFFATGRSFASPSGAPAATHL